MGSANLSHAEAAARSAQIVVHHSAIALDVSDAKADGVTHFGVHASIRLTSQTPDLWLDFLDAEVNALAVDGLDQTVDYDGARLRVNVPAGVETIVVVTGRARYSRSGQGMHRFVDPVDGETYLYTQYEPADARRVFPNFEQPDLKTSYSFSVTAPAGWWVASNGEEVAVEHLDEATTRHFFASTKPMSTYITAIVAGPYHYVTDEWVSPSGLRVPLGLACRASLAEYLEADELFTLTKEGLTWFDEAFAYPYPWGKYDQIFVPEYNLGAMENPGCVTFTESYIYRSAATRAQRQARANTLLHEMSHMWFGDLVTPAWWDDLWLKESFAEFMGAHVSEKATQYDQAWVGFAGGRKAWAYAADQLPSTHPIMAEVADLEAAKQAFDGITYAKGAAALKQLVAHVGTDNFFAASRDFFRAHEFGSARLADFLGALEATSGRDLALWSRAWLQTAGVDTLTPTRTDGTLTITRAASLPGPSRPHTFDLGLYKLTGDELERVDCISVDLPARADEITIDLPVDADLALINDNDLTYAKVRFDDRSLDVIEDQLATIASPLSRAVIWGALWDMTRDGVYLVGDYLQLLVDHADDETDPATLTTLTNNAIMAINKLTPHADAPEMAKWAFGQFWTLMGASAPGSDAQLLWARTAITIGAQVKDAAGVLKGLVNGSSTVRGLDIDHDLRWRIMASLAALGVADDETLRAELANDDTADGRTKYLVAHSARPDAAVKGELWERLHTPGGLTNNEMDAMISGFAVPGQSALTLPFAGAYFSQLRDIWASFPIEMSSRLVRGLFPRARGAVVAGIDAHPEVSAATAWLEANGDAPAALRRIVIEELDHLRRDLAAQEFNAGGVR